MINGGATIIIIILFALLFVLVCYSCTKRGAIPVD